MAQVSNILIRLSAEKNCGIFVVGSGSLDGRERSANGLQQAGAKIGIAVVMNQNHSKNFEEISNVSKSSALVDKLVILTNTNIPSSNSATIVNMDKSKMVDLIYFDSKYTNHKIIHSDNEKAQMLAKTVNIL